VQMTSHKQHIAGVDSSLQVREGRMRRDFDLFQDGRGSQIQLYRSYVRGWPDDFDDKSRHELRALVDVTSQTMTRVEKIIAFGLALMLATTTLLVIANVGRPWYVAQHPVMALASLLAVGALETLCPGHQDELLAGLLLSPLLFCPWYGLLRWRYRNDAPEPPPEAEAWDEVSAAPSKGGAK